MQKYLIANWKLNDNEKFCRDWLLIWQGFSPLPGITTIVCPSFPFIPLINEQKPLISGAQDVSKYKEGSHTGDVSAKELLDLVQYCIVGHSERRKEYGDTIEVIKQKMQNLLSVNITPILCLEDVKDLSIVTDAVKKSIVVLEPSENISDGGEYKKLDFSNLRMVAVRIKEMIGTDTPLLYGGSVNRENASQIKDLGLFDGVLIGKASLNPKEFFEIGKIWQEK